MRRAGSPSSWLAVTWLVGFGLVACGDAEPRYSIATDPLLEPPTEASLVYDFETQRHLFKGIGWYLAGSSDERWAWSEITSTVYFSLPQAASFDLVVRLDPYHFDAAPRQAIRLLVNGTQIGRRALDPGWQELHIPVDASAVREGVNELRFRFAYATRPADVSDSDDLRELAARFSTIRFVRSSPAERAQTPPVTTNSSIGPAPDSSGPDPSQSPVASESVAGRPWIFVYMIDTLRADALGVYGARRDTSPRMNAFAQDSVVFEQAWSTSAWTLPSTLSLLTGQYPHRHGYTKASIASVPHHDLERMPEVLRDLGYDTLAISQTYVAGVAYGMDEGFDHFYQNDELGIAGQYSANIRWFLWQHLRHRPAPEKPLFAYLHCVAPHSPYTPSGAGARWSKQRLGFLRSLWRDPEPPFEGIGREPEQIAHARAQYDGEVLYADEQFGDFLDLLREVGVYDDSLILVTSDHGEEFYEHGGFDHSRTLYEELLHVPLIVKLPRSHFAGTRVAQPVSSADVLPTLLDVLGASSPGPADDARFDGRSLLPLLESPNRPSDEAAEVFAETSPEGTPGHYADVDLMALALGRIKCIFNRKGVDRFFEQQPAFTVFDLSSDPTESTALALEDPRSARCIRRLLELAERADRNRPDTAGAITIDPAERARLEALGYL